MLNEAEFTRLDALDYAGSEAFNTLSTNLSFAGKDKKKIMVTSCQPSEGKSFVTLNLMRTLSLMGKRVVLVDGDLRLSQINARYGVNLPADAPGLANYLAGLCEKINVIYKTNIRNAMYVPVGRVVSNSLMLLSSDRFPELLKSLTDTFDYVLIDSTPIGAIIDAAEIAKSCDGALIVVNHGEVKRRELQEAKRQIELSGCMVLGAILNRVNFDKMNKKKYYYYSGHDKATNTAARPMKMRSGSSRNKKYR